MLKSWPTVYRKLEREDMSLDERISFARSIAASPSERWEMNLNCIRALGLCQKRIRSVSDLEKRKAELRRRDGMHLWKLRQSNTELKQGRLFGSELLKELECV